MKLVYITSSSFSGSTLLAFLLNAHPRIFTVSEMEGWGYGANEEFACSCGSALPNCTFFGRLPEAFARERLPFDFRDFCTAYRLARHERLNRYLTAALPWLRSTRIERLRDRLVARIPYFARRIEQCHRANATFFRAGREFRGADVFVDATKNPYRLRFLSRQPDVDLTVLYLTRDIRGVALSFMENRGWSASRAARAWIDEQTTILRILKEFRQHLHVFYEDVCAAPDEELQRMHALAGLRPLPLPPDFKRVDHHILGNTMRLESGGRIVMSQRWKEGLSHSDLRAITEAGREFVRRHADAHPLSAILRRYLD